LPGTFDPIAASFLSSTLRSQPLCQLLQVSVVHAQDQFLAMNWVNGQNVIFMENDFIELLQPMQPMFDERIVHEAFEETSLSLGNSHPEIFTPAT